MGYAVAMRRCRRDARVCATGIAARYIGDSMYGFAFSYRLSGMPFEGSVCVCVCVYIYIIDARVSGCDDEFGI